MLRNKTSSIYSFIFSPYLILGACRVSVSEGGREVRPGTVAVASSPGSCPRAAFPSPTKAFPFFAGSDSPDSTTTIDPTPSTGQ